MEVTVNDRTMPDVDGPELRRMVREEERAGEREGRPQDHTCLVF